MIRSLTIRVVLCLIVVLRVSAAPVLYGDVRPLFQDPARPKATAGAPETSAQKTQTIDQPDFVRLADGRIVPYGAGIICTDDCIQTEMTMAEGTMWPKLAIGSLSPWLWAIPILAAAATCFAICRGGGSAVLGVIVPPNVNPTPTPTPAVDIPEPATLALLGLGLAFLAWFGLGRRRPWHH